MQQVIYRVILQEIILIMKSIFIRFFLCQFPGFIIYFAYGVWFSLVNETLPNFTIVNEREDEQNETRPLLK